MVLFLLFAPPLSAQAEGPPSPFPPLRSGHSYGGRSPLPDTPSLLRSPAPSLPAEGPLSAPWWEDLLEIFPELAVDEDLQQRIQELIKNPVLLNTCQKEELLSIPGLDPLLAGAILDHREKSGAFQSMYELQGLKGMNPKLFGYLSQVLTLKGASAETGPKTWKGEYLLLIHPPAEVEGEGLPFRQWHRFKGSYGKNLSVGLSLENDAGEAFRWKSQQKGFDFGTFFMDYRDPKRGWHLILGDYRVNSAQGLVHGTSGSFGSATWVGRVFKQDNARGYRSSDENLFLRGLYMERTTGKWRTRVFVSRLRSDGTVMEGGSAESGTGLHRTPTELAKRKQFLRMSTGHSLRYSLKKGELSWQNLIVKDNGRVKYQSSLYHQFTLGSWLLFGEWAYGSYGFSGMEAMVLSPSPRFELSALFRVYPRENANPYAGGFSSFSKPENERGLYLSAEYRTANKQSWRAYSDYVYRPYPSYLVSTPYLNSTHFLQTETRIDGLLTTVRLQRELGKRDQSGEEYTWKHTETWTSTKLRLQLEGKSGPNWIYKSRIEYHFYQQGEKQQGVLLFQELQWRPPLKGYYLILRFTHFSVSDYDARIYAYESDVLYAFSVPMFSGKGQRVYLVYRQGLGRNWDVWFKGAYTRYESAFAEKASADKWEGKVLVKWSF